VVCVSVAVLNKAVSRTNMAELIEMLFGACTWWGPRNRDVGLGPPQDGALLGVNTVLPVIDILNLFHYWAAVMQLRATSLLQQGVYNTHTHHLMVLFWDYLGEPVPER